MMKYCAAPLLAAVALAALPAGCAKSEHRQVDAASSQEDLMRQRATAIINGLSAGDADAYEAIATENYTADLLGRRSPGDRAQFVAAMTGEFGRMEVRSMIFNAGALEIEVAGASGQIAFFVFAFDETPDRRISGIEIRSEASGQGAGDGPQMPPPPVSVDMAAADFSAAMEGWLAPVIEHDDFAGVIIVAHQGEPFVSKVYGLADRENGRAANADTTYNIASIGKKFTHVAIARLIEDGRLTPETTLGEVLPDYPDVDARKATVNQLIGMQGGISDFFGPEFEALPKRDFASNHDYYVLVSKLPQRFSPGTSKEYCNGCYVVLGEMIEKIAGEPFETFVQSQVFDPAAMKRSGYFNAERLPENSALLYGRSDGPGSDYVSMSGKHGAAGSGAGGVYSTAGDLLAFDNALRDGRLLDPQMTAFVLGGETLKADRNMTPMAIAGGAPGTSALLESNGEWAVIVTANVSEPLPERIGVALAHELVK